MSHAINQVDLLFSMRYPSEPFLDLLGQSFAGQMHHRTNGLGWVGGMKYRCARNQDLCPGANDFSDVFRTDPPVDLDAEVVIMPLFCLSQLANLFRRSRNELLASE